ncbi:MAG: cell division protein FtsI [Candidatus Lumbricidophila eiseniae]|uniref:Cell division protein FtsI n=1 Tax=Candidatus Lumbricidiphila eiseniae TaxID=1969409 RepID=A0A2A6FTU8_9MICO|nr:MAG: cell division protein FtsI [Candidatus Lumbricidophila eiseniae]
MTRELRRVTLLIFAMFAALLVSTTTIQYAQAGNLAADSRNVRTLYESYSTQRGPILVKGTPIASSVPSADNYKYLRSYADGPMYSAVTGFYPVNGEPTGLEYSMNAELSGTSSGQFFDRLKRLVTGQVPVGASVETTIDPVAQKAAWDALGSYTGSVIVTEPATGRIVAMVSKPGYDPNILAVHEGNKVDASYRALTSDPGSPLINRAISGNLNPPGSVFKLVVASAALESGRYTGDSELPNPGALTLPGTTAVVHNSDDGTCGSGATATIATALRLSCNIPFAELGMELGGGAIRAQAEKYGFNSTFTIPMTTAASVYPRVLDVPQTGLSAFGQGNDRVTPIQMAIVSSTIANGGMVMVPSVVESVTAPDLTPISGFNPATRGRAISEKTATALTRMMVDNVRDGAASNARIEGVAVAGKTGTAENGTTDPYTLWFTGFAPADNPRYAITVLVENGGGLGQTGYGNLVAAPIAKKVLEAVLKK